MKEVDSTASARSNSRVASWCGIAFTVFFVVGLALAGASTDTSNKSDDEVLKVFRDHKAAAVTSAYLLVLAALAFLPLAWAVTRRVAAGLSPLAEQMARWTAPLFSAMLLAASMAFATVALTVVFGNEVDPSADIVRFVPGLGFPLLLIAGALPLGVFLVIISRGGQVAGTLPKWLCILGYVAAAAMLAAPVFIPIVFLPIWAIATSISLRRQLAQPAA
jgi:hypothetical protein